jgi:two-component system, chemotaxis family, sensor kinase CheA
MDNVEYMPMFLAEAREYLQELNVAVVTLEEQPDDRATVDQIFRIAHSLKGMSATMGYTTMAELTHEMEDVFELLRQRTSALVPDAIDTLLACLDALSESVDSIEAGDDELLDPLPLIGRLRHLIRGRTDAQALQRAGGARLPELPAIAAARAAGARIVHVTAALDERVLMPAVRAHMLFAALAEHGELLGSVPGQDGIEQFTGTHVDAWLACELDLDEVASLARGISEIAEVDVREFPEEHTAEPESPATSPAAAAPARTAPPEPAQAKAQRTVRVDAERLDALVHLVGELARHRTTAEGHIALLDAPDLHDTMACLTNSAEALQSMVMQVRMMPLDAALMRLPRLVRDLSTKLGKDVELELIGHDTELDRTVVDALADPLVHLVRNALDHGLEPPEIRLAAGKSRVGRLTVAARPAGANVVIEVSDDGRGIDPAAVARNAVELGLIDAEQAAVLDRSSATELLFAPGFTTAVLTSDISGRGVGMDAVRTRVTELGGEVAIESRTGSGTTATIRLPLTLAIVPALHVEIGGAPFAIPLDRVERTQRLTTADHGGGHLSLQDGSTIPLLDGAAIFGVPARGAAALAVIVRCADGHIALAIDSLAGRRELVARPLPAIVGGSQPLSGGAVLPDGQIALIVDCDALAAGLAGPAAISAVPSSVRRPSSGPPRRSYGGPATASGATR